MQEFSLVFLVIAIVLIIFLFKKRKELHLGNPQLFLYALIGLIICIRSLYAFTEISSPGVDFLTGVLIVIFAMLSFLVGLLCIAWALMIYPKVKEKLPSIVNHKLFNNYTTPVVLIIIMAASNFIESIANSKQSKVLGFSNESDFKDAKRNNIYSTEEYSKYLANKKAIEAKNEEDTNEKERIESEKKSEKDRIANLDKMNEEAKNHIESKLNSLDKKSVDYRTSKFVYEKYGVWYGDLDSVTKQYCSSEFDKLKRAHQHSKEAINNWNQVSDSLRNSGIDPFTGGRSITTDPEIIESNNMISRASNNFEKCEIDNLDKIKYRVKVKH